MKSVENKKLDLLREQFNNFTKLPFPNPVDEIDQEKDPHGALLYLDEDIAVAILSWVEPNHKDENHFHQKRNLTKEINLTEGIIKSYNPKNKYEEQTIETMIVYLKEIKKLHNTYIKLWNN